jgi:hypothetical protein
MTSKLSVPQQENGDCKKYTKEMQCGICGVCGGTRVESRQPTYPSYLQTAQYEGIQSINQCNKIIEFN